MASVGTVPCLICYNSTFSTSSSTCGGVSATREQVSCEDTSILSKDLHAMFVLKNLFEVPGEKLQGYLKQNGSPSEWAFVAFCSRCKEAVENAKGIHQEIVEASRIFAAVKGEIVESVKRSWTRQLTTTFKKEQNSKRVNGKVENDVVKIIEDTREFIFKRDYGPSSDPFLEADLIADDLHHNLPSSLEPEKEPEPYHDALKHEFRDSEGDDDNDYLDFSSENSAFSDEQLPQGSEMRDAVLDNTPASHLLMAPNDLEVQVPNSVQTLKLEDKNDKIKRKRGRPPSTKHNLTQSYPNASTTVKAKIKENIESRSDKKMSKRSSTNDTKIKAEVNSISRMKSLLENQIFQTARNLQLKRLRKKNSLDNPKHKLERKLSFPNQKSQQKEQLIFKCDYKDCGKVYLYKHHLQKHLMYHRNEKPFSCPWPNCPWRFTRADVLRRHYKNHLREKLFKCQFCPKEYTRKDVLDHHFKIYHKQDQERLNNKTVVQDVIKNEMIIDCALNYETRSGFNEAL